MTKEQEFIDTYLYDYTQELKDVAIKDLKSIIAQAIAEHEAGVDKLLIHPNVRQLLRFGVKSPSRCGLDDSYGVCELYYYSDRLMIQNKLSKLKEGGEG